MPLPSTIFESLTLITKGPGCSFLTTVISTLGKSPMAAKRLHKPWPAITLISVTLSPEPTVDRGLSCLSSIRHSLCRQLGCVLSCCSLFLGVFFELGREVVAVLIFFCYKFCKVQEPCDHLRPECMLGSAGSPLGGIRIDAQEVDEE